LEENIKLSSKLSSIEKKFEKEKEARRENTGSKNSTRV
jgi:hypothetical protein